ncbi:acetate---CoA ligase (ADP-forming) subunit alpha,acdB; acetate---CoA ligase (ADP-forming) subunit beta [Anaerolineales bacterium]|nr:acetate---CoA ligase (ADP-forming) subunit alpha,acdB; acetate---CoA ligase (ADP-forming) subunit beta [Anaerolineales bacterium]
MDQTALNNLLQPKSVAIVGASTTPGKIGYTVIENLIKGGYQGKVYPINPTAKEILSFPVFPNIGAVPGSVDLAVITVPVDLVNQVAEECGQKGIKALSVITSGFSEVGRKDLEDQLLETARKYGMCVLGPNIVGTLSNSDKLNASFAPFLPFPGKATLITQSGALLIAMDAITYTRKVGFDKMISIGNMADVNFADLITWLDKDENTSCICLYIEGLKDGRKFIEAGRKTKKPIIALKSGVSAHGAAAAASHTGSLAGAVKVYGAAFQQAGVVQASDLNNLFDRTLALSLMPPLRKENLLIITNGGGVGVLATDAAERYGIPLKFAPEDVQEELKKHMPAFGSAKNPVDLTGMAGNDWYYKSVKYAFAHPWTDGIVVLYCETAMTNPVEIAQAIKKAVDETGIKDRPVIVSMVGGKRCDEAMQWLVDNGIPAYPAPDQAMNGMAALREYNNIRLMNIGADEGCGPRSSQMAREIIAKARADGRTALTEIEAKKLFAAYGLPVTEINLAKSEDEAVELAKKTGYPVVMKVVSPDIIHKSDAGGVKVNIKDEAGVRAAFETIMANCRAYKAEADIRGIAVQEMAPLGTEVIVGSINDPTFGPTIMFGLGGIFVEVLKDVTFRVAPVNKEQVRQMIGEIRSVAILAGARGEAPRDRAALADLLCRYASMVYDLRDEVAETDANPVLVYEEGKGVKAVDARIILKKK